METLDYNYKKLKLEDLRYRGSLDKGYYILAFNSVPPVNIERTIFENVLFKIYGPTFIKDVTIKELFAMEWNAYISSGYYMQWSDNDKEYIKKPGQPDRNYISRIDKAGVLSELTYSN